MKRNTTSISFFVFAKIHFFFWITSKTKYLFIGLLVFLLCECLAPILTNALKIIYVNSFKNTNLVLYSIQKVTYIQGEIFGNES